MLIAWCTQEELKPGLQGQSNKDFSSFVEGLTCSKVWCTVQDKRRIGITVRFSMFTQYFRFRSTCEQILHNLQRRSTRPVDRHSLLMCSPTSSVKLLKCTTSSDRSSSSFRPTIFRSWLLEASSLRKCVQALTERLTRLFRLTSRLRSDVGNAGNCCKRLPLLQTTDAFSNYQK